MNIQLPHDQSIFTKKQFPLLLICDQVNSPANVGSLFRVADSFGLEKIIFCGDTFSTQSKRMLRTSRSTHKIVPFALEKNIENVLINLTGLGYELIGLEITNSSESIDQTVFTKDQKIALVIGEENQGISEAVLSQLSRCVHIHMFGTNTSMNVAIATSIALYEITKQLSS